MQDSGMNYEIHNVYIIDNRHFVQGFEFLDDSTLLISSGWWGRSMIGKFSVDFDNLVVEEIATQPIDETYFGEGSTMFNNELYMLTWTNGKILKFDMDLNPLGEFDEPLSMK